MRWCAFVIAVVLASATGCSCSDTGPAEIPALTPEEERRISEQFDKGIDQERAQQEAAEPQPENPGS